MIDVTEVARGIHRISMFDEQDLVSAGIFWPGASYNLFLIAADEPAIVNTMYRRSFVRLRERVARIVDPARLAYIVVPHHEGDSSGALNEWLRAAPEAVALCSELCASLSLRDFSDREPHVVKDEQVVDLGSHRLRFFLTPQVNQWDSLIVYEETTRTLFSNDLFSSFGTEVTSNDRSAEAIGVLRQLGYQPNDHAALLAALDKIGSLDVASVACMHGPTVTGNYDRLVLTFRDAVGMT